jgi:hypothetical protein
LDIRVDLGFDLKGFQQNPQAIIPPGKPEGNIAHIVHNAVSPEITYGGLQDSDVCSWGRDWECGVYLLLMHHILLLIHIDILFIYQGNHACML